MRHTLTIIYFKDQSGKARILEFSLRGLLFAILGFFILLLLLVALFSISIKLSIERDTLIRDITSIRQEKKSLEAKLFDLEARITKAETAVHSTGNAAAKPHGDVKESLSSEEAPSEVKGGAAFNEKGERRNLVSLQNLEIQRGKDGAELSIAFDLIKENKKGVLTQGYVFIVGDYGDFFFTFPEDIEIQEGMPVDFKTGDHFAIKWHKHIERTFPLTTSANIKNISILIFSENGSLLMKKDISPD